MTTHEDDRGDIDGPARARFARAKAVFCAAIDRPGPARAAFVAAACGGDEALKREVESLLASDGQASGFIEVPAPDALADSRAGSGSEVSGRAGESTDPTGRVPRLQAGDSVGAYVIEGLLGAGGMGEVYRACDTRLGRLAAIKIVGERQGSGRADAALLREARHASVLNHPSICGIYEVGDFGGRAFIAMEYVEGETLRARVARMHPLAAADILRCGIRVADALDHAHRRGVIHRDLKSANIMIGDDGRVTVLDFGLSRWLPEAAGAESSAPLATETLALAGTLDYMAPEVLLGAAADIRADVWSLGILLFEMAAGEPPFKKATPFETLSSILRAPLPPLPTGLPVGLSLVVARCLERNPGRRYQHAADVLADLEALQKAGGARRRLVTRLALRKLSSGGVVRAGLGTAAAGAAVVAALAAGAWWATPTGTLPSRVMRSVAVMPLEYTSVGSAEQYFVDGITEALITDIGETGVDRVISRTTSMRFRDARKPPPVVARELGVEAVVEGTVSRTPGRVRLSVRLRDGVSGRELWSIDDEGPTREVGALVSRIAAGIAGGMNHRVTGKDPQQRAAMRAVDPDVYEAYLKGRYYWNQRMEDSLRRAIEHYQAAINRDPTYAPAKVALADCYNQLGTVLVGSGPPSDYRPLASASVLKALQIDPDLAEAHATLGYIRHYDWQWDDSEREFELAIRLNPSNPLAHIWYANLLASRRRFQEAIREVQLARDLDPFSLAVHTNVGWVLSYAGRSEDAMAQYRRALEFDPDYVQAHTRLGAALAAAGRLDEAIVEYELAVRLTRESASSLAALAEVYARAGRPAEARALLNRLLGGSPGRYVPPAAIAGVYEELGDVDAAFAWLDKAYDERSNHMAYLAVEPHARLRADPRYAGLLRRVGLE